MAPGGDYHGNTRTTVIVVGSYQSTSTITAAWSIQDRVDRLVIQRTPRDDTFPDLQGFDVSFVRKAETDKERRQRLARMRTVEAIRAARHAVPGALSERQYHRPLRRGRACGSRHMVML